MRAVVLDRFGGPEVLRLREIPRPEPGTGQVRVAIHASGTNPVDVSNRTDGSWAKLKPPVVLGYEASGVIDAVGRGVESLAVGSEVIVHLDVIGTQMGTYAEYVVADADSVAAKPTNLTHSEAAALPLAGSTAYAIVAKRLDIQPGEWLLVNGAAGGVGCFVAQLAVAWGAHVIGVASQPRHHLLRELGVEICIDYTRGDPIDAIRQAVRTQLDAVVDLVGGELLARSLPLIRPYGRAATIVSLAGDLDLAIDGNITLHGVLVRPSRWVLDALTQMVESRRLRPIIDQVLPLAEARRAHERLATGRGQGKIVLQMR
jgi:NADPH:quinone reductase